MSSCEWTGSYEEVNLTSFLFKASVPCSSYLMGCFPCRKYVVWMSTLLLQAVLGVVETSGPLTDLGRPSRIQVLLLSQAILLQLMCSIEQPTSPGGWFSIRWRGTPPMWGTQGNWLQRSPLRPCLNSSIPRRTSARQSSPTPGTWGTGRRTLQHLKLKYQLGFAWSRRHHLISRAGRWSKGPSRSSATITPSQGTTHCGWK